MNRSNQRSISPISGQLLRRPFISFGAKGLSKSSLSQLARNFRFEVKTVRFRARARRRNRLSIFRPENILWSRIAVIGKCPPTLRGPVENQPPSLSRLLPPPHTPPPTHMPPNFL